MFSGRGQPSLSPALLLMVVVLQFRHNLSGREAVLAVADRISWKYALGRELSDPGFDHTVLSEFRTRLAADGRADAVFGLMLALFEDCSYRGVWGKPTAGLEGLPLVRPAASSLSRARRRVGAAPLRRLFEILAGPVAHPGQPGSFFGPGLLPRGQGHMGRTVRDRRVPGGLFPGV